MKLRARACMYILTHICRHIYLYTYTWIYTTYQGEDPQNNRATVGCGQTVAGEQTNRRWSKEANTLDFLHMGLCSERTNREKTAVSCKLWPRQKEVMFKDSKDLNGKRQNGINEFTREQARNSRQYLFSRDTP